MRLGFIKRVAAFHLASLIVVGGVAYSPFSLPRDQSWWPMAVLLLTLAVLRVALRRGPREATISTYLLIPLLVCVGLALSPVQTAGFPLWSLVLGPGFALIYALICGRDFSFMGQYLLSLIASTTIIAALWVSAPDTLANARWSLAANTVFLTFIVYDSASLLARRRLGEELAAVVDLYRDVLNFSGYLVRCIKHWRKHRIWIVPR